MSNLRANNNSAARNFTMKLYTASVQAGRAAMEEVASAGVKQMLDDAQFGDYTGVLANSYQGAILERGKLRPKGYGGSFVSQDGELKQVLRGAGGRFMESEPHTFRDGNGAIHLYTSNGMKGAEHISFKSYMNKRASIQLRKERSGRHAPFIRYRRRFIEYTRRNYPDGYGRNITAIKAANVRIKKGFAVVFGNGAPYAQTVHNNWNRVFPTNDVVPSGYLHTIYLSRMRESIAYWKNRYGK